MAAWIRKSTKIFNIHLAQISQEVSNGQTNALLVGKEKPQTVLNALLPKGTQQKHCTQDCYQVKTTFLSHLTCIVP